MFRNRASLAVQVLVIGGCVAAIFAVSSCKKVDQPEPNASLAKTYASPEDAGKALAEATKSGNPETVLAIFGSASKDLISSGDPAEDKASMEGFSKAYQVMNRLRKLPDGSELLLVGADNQAFPIPLKKNSSGQWFFDAEAGKQEILAQRIGRDEIVAVDVSAALADAQEEYFSQKHDGVKQYAQKFISDPGKQNGLYWESPAGQPRSPLGPLVAFASNEGFTIQRDKYQPFHGYFFQRLDKQGPDAKGGAKEYIVNGKMTGGFAYIAYPEKYNDTGIMTFIIDADRVVYQKNLGKDTADLAKAISNFNPDKSWTALK